MLHTILQRCRILNSVAMSVLLCLTLSMPAAATERQQVTVFAAASLKGSMMVAISEFETLQPDSDIRLSVAASSTLARQIEAGAPADIYASANLLWAEYLAGQGMLVPGWRSDWLGNRLVLIATGGDVVITVMPHELRADERLIDKLPEGERLAVGDPEHVPVGRYARAALESLGQWDALRPRLAPTADTLATIALVGTGVAPLGIAYGSDALLSDRVRVVAYFPDSSHPPIRYSLGLIDRQDGQQNELAQAFFDFLQTPSAMRIFADHGFRTDAPP